MSIRLVLCAFAILASVLLLGTGQPKSEPEPQKQKAHAIKLGAEDLVVYQYRGGSGDLLIAAWGDGLLLKTNRNKDGAHCWRGRVEPQEVQKWLEESAGLQSHDGELYGVPDGPDGAFFVRCGGRKALLVEWDEVILPCWGSNVTAKNEYVQCASAWVSAKIRLVSLCCNGKEVDFTADEELQRRTGCKTLKDLERHWWR